MPGRGLCVKGENPQDVGGDRLRWTDSGTMSLPKGGVSSDCRCGDLIVRGFGLLFRQTPLAARLMGTNQDWIYASQS